MCCLFAQKRTFHNVVGGGAGAGAGGDELNT